MKADPQARIKLCICHATKLPTPSHKRRWLLGSVVDEYIPHSKLGNRHQPRTRRAVLWCVVLRPIGKKGQLLNQVYEKGDDILGLTLKYRCVTKFASQSILIWRQRLWSIWHHTNEEVSVHVPVTWHELYCQW